MVKKMKNKEGKIKDLAEKLEKDELTEKETIKILKERGVSHEEKWQYFIPYIVWVILCFPLNLMFELPAIQFPMAIIYLAVILFILVVCIEVYVVYHWRMKKGGLHSEDETVVLFREGPYGIVRHPSNINRTVAFITITVAISNHVPFTILSIIANIGLIVYHYWGTLVEEELNLKKWGDEYRQYMKEVPQFNFIKGLWNLKKRGN